MTVTKISMMFTPAQLFPFFGWLPAAESLPTLHRVAIAIVSLVLMIGIIVGLFIWIRRKNENKRRTWNFIAQKHPGLKCTGPPQNENLEGTFHAVPIKMNTVVRSTGNTTQTFTHFTAFFSRDLPGEVELYRQGLLASASKIFGAQDIEIGDKRFDDKVMVKSTPPEAAHRLLADIETRNTVLDAISRMPEIRVQCTKIWLEKSGIVSDEETIIEILETFTRLVTQLEKAAAKAETPQT